MAEDDASKDADARLIERLEHLERVLQANTQRLHAIEQHLRLDAPPPRVEQRRPLYESIIDEREETTAAPPPRHVVEGDGARREASPGGQTTTTGAPRAPYDPGHTPHDAGRVPPRSDVPPRAQTPPPQTPPPPTGAWGAAGAWDDERSREGAQVRAGVEAAPRRDLESVIGGSWFNWIGIIAFTFGVAFFLKYAFENEWVGPAGRVGLGAAAGLAILVFADRLRARGLRQYAYVLSGGGVLILYLSIYAAFNFYQLIGQPLAFVLMALVTTGAVLLSVRHDALPVAVLGLIGGFLTPVLLSTGRDNQVGLFTYVALLDAGVLALAYFKRWRSLDFMSFAATALMFFGWLVTHYDNPAELWPTVFFLTLFFLMFSALAPAHNLLPRTLSRWHDILIVIANATFYFGTTYILLDYADYDRALGSFALLVSAFFVVLFYAAWSRGREDRLLVHSYAGAAVTFFTMAVAIQTDQHWVTIGWAAEALMLVWVGLRAQEPAARHAALAVFAVALAHWFGWDVGLLPYGEPAADFVPLLNRRALSCAALVGALAGAAWLHRREGARVGREDEETAGALAGGDGDGGRGWVAAALEEHSAAATLYTLAANALALALLTLDLNDYFERRLALAGDGQAHAAGRVENTRSFSLTALWTIYATTMFALGVRRRFRALRYVALALLLLASLKALATDLAFYAAPWHVPVLNQTCMAFALVVAAYAFAVRLYRGAALAPDDEERAVIPVLVVLANVLAVVALSAEAIGYFEARAATFADGQPRDRYLAQQLALSLVWAVYGGGLLLFGYLKRNRLLRVFGLLLLSLTTVKVFFVDLSALDRVYRIISFIALGAVLLAVSYLYQKTQKKVSDEPWKSKREGPESKT